MLARSVSHPAARWALLSLASLSCLVFTTLENRQGAMFMAAICLAAVASSVAGFAFSAICGAMLFHLSGDPVSVVQIMITCSIANQATMTWSARGDVDWPSLVIYLGGGIIGLASGVWLLLHADRVQYTTVLGGFLVVYGAFMLFRKPFIIHGQHVAFDFLVGMLGGVTGGAAGFPGASVTIWCGMKGWDKARQRAMFQPFILIMQIAALFAISLSRQSVQKHSGFEPQNLLFVPASLLGTSLGLALYRRLSDSQFARAINLLLIVSGLSYIF